MAIRIFSGVAIPQGGRILSLPPSLEICMKRGIAGPSKPVKTGPDSRREGEVFFATTQRILRDN